MKVRENRSILPPQVGSIRRFLKIKAIEPSEEPSTLFNLLVQL